jgi:hypothetical protein
LRSVGIAVRDCASFGLPNHVRVVAHPEQSRLVQAWAQFLEAQVLEAQVVETQVVETQVVERQVPKGRTS